MSYLLVGAYLFAIVAANLSVTAFGAIAIYYSAFLLIPFDLTSRDILHERWTNKSLGLKMFLLIFSGSIISYLINKDAKQIAIASCISFCIAGSIDFIVYEGLKWYSKAFKMNASNIVSAIIDSIVFPLIAFKMIDPAFSLGQSSLKIFGGILWTLVLGALIKKRY